MYLNVYTRGEGGVNQDGQVARGTSFKNLAANVLSHRLGKSQHSSIKINGPQATEYRHLKERCTTCIWILNGDEIFI